jgi:hypothetical protein
MNFFLNLILIFFNNFLEDIYLMIRATVLPVPIAERTVTLPDAVSFLLTIMQILLLIININIL